MVALQVEVAGNASIKLKGEMVAVVQEVADRFDEVGINQCIDEVVVEAEQFVLGYEFLHLSWSMAGHPVDHSGASCESNSNVPEVL